jgi:DNA-binding LytR/AlgR family response regulator
MKPRYLIVDDEPLARKLIASHTSKIDGLELAGECGNAVEAANFLRSQSVDLIFLDIQMPEITGLQFIGTLKNPPAIIFTTAFRDFAPEAFELDVIDYLLKPISFERLLKAVNKFFDRRDPRPGSTAPAPVYMNIKSDRQVFKVLLNDIMYVESLDDYVKVHLNDKMIITRENITMFESRLPTELFVRIHRSFIVNIKCVRSVSAEGIKMKDKELPFGRVFKKGALERLGVGE